MLIIHLRISGLVILALVAIYPIYPVWFDWQQELQSVSLLTRQLFWVHIGFICLLLAMQGILLTGWPRTLVTPAPAALVLAIGMTTFWAYRLLAQVAFYSPELWWGQPLHLTVHVVFVALWVYLTSVCAWALCHQAARRSTLPPLGAHRPR